MSTSPSTNDPRRLEQIVAYLDGELSPVEVSLVEKQLAEDADFRNELQSIERAWLALDALPITKVDDRFSQTTMEIVVGVARQELVEQTRALPIRRRNTLLTRILLTAAAAALGLLMVRLVRDNPNRVLLADLPAIEYIDIYSQFRDVDFLRKLHGELGDGVWVADLTEEDLAAQTERFNTIAQVDNRRDWIAQLDEEDRAALRARYNRFLAMSVSEQSRLKDLHAALLADPRHAQLENTMLQYQVWLNALSASQQFELREKRVDERVRQIVTQQRREANNHWIKLSPEEFRRLSKTMAEIREQLMQDMGIQNRGEKRGPNSRDPNNHDRDRNQTFAQQIRRQFIDHRDEWLPEILNSLSDGNRVKLAELEPMQQQRQIVRWVMESRTRDEGRRGGGQRRPFDLISQQELERFFADETDGPTKERLLALPRDKMEQQLKRLYFRGALPEGVRPEGDRPNGDFRPRDRPMGPPPRGDRGGYGPRRGGPGFGPPRGPRDDDRGPPPPPDEAF
jgi:hypothetical protein